MLFSFIAGVGLHNRADCLLRVRVRVDAFSLADELTAVSTHHPWMNTMDMLYALFIVPFFSRRRYNRLDNNVVRPDMFSST